MKAKIMIAMLALVSLSVIGCAEPKNYDSFAKCLTGAGVVMYGSELCPHCTAVKEDFGNSFKYIEYVECNEYIPGAEPERCMDAEVQYLPTFEFGDGTKLFGELRFDILSQKTGCELP